MRRSRQGLAGLFSVAAVLGMVSPGDCRLSAQSAQPAEAEKSSPPSPAITETVDLLEGSRLGRLGVVAHGQGQDRVRLTIRNTTRLRLNVVLPPGLVAVGAAGQRGGGGGGGGMQSIGLGMVSNRPGTFGQFRDGPGPEGLLSVGLKDVLNRSAVTVPPGESLDLVVPGVCLNYGLPAPTPRDVLTLKDVESYSSDARVRRALRSLCLLGTSQGVAQAVAWHLCDDLPFETMAEQARNAMNEPEIALAARFVEALDASTGPEPVASASLKEHRLFVRVLGEGPLVEDARRLNDQIEGQRILGLPIDLVHGDELPAASAPALSLKVVLGPARDGEIRGRIGVSYAPAADRWTPLGKAVALDGSKMAIADGKSLAQALDHALAQAFVSVKPARRSVGSTTLRVDNHLPFTLAHVTLRAGNSPGAPTVPFPGIGIGPGRSALLPIQAATAVIEHVELNGL